MSEQNDVLRGLPKFVELEIAKAAKPLSEEIDDLKQRIAKLEKERPQGFLQRLGFKG